MICTPKDSKINTTPALIRGVAARFTQENAMDLPYVIGPRRDGDLPAFWADAEKAKNHLGWEATHTVEDMCRSAWLFAKNSNP